MDVLTYERLDGFNTILDIMDKMSTTLEDHSLCAQYTTRKSKCLWPRYHGDLMTLTETDIYLGEEITQGSDKRAYQTRLGDK